MSFNPVYFRRRLVVVIIFLCLLFVTFLGIKSCARWLKNRFQPIAVEIIKGQIETGQVLQTSLLADGISREAANEVVLSISNVLNLTSLRVGEKYSLYLDKDDKIVKFIYEKSPIDQYFCVRGKKGQFNSFKPTIYLDKKVLTKEFTIKSSLFSAILKQDEDEALVFEIVDVYAWDIDFYTYPRQGDKIKIYFEKYFYRDKFIKYGRIYAAQYKGRDTFEAVYFTPKNNRAGYYNLMGKPVEKMFLKSPLKFTGRITSYFGGRRDPFTSRHGGHNGVDFAAYYGAPIVATSDGRVTYAGWRGAYGRLLIVQHSNGYSTRYGHCSRLLVGRGGRVRQGQVIAKVGSTGRSTGPHVHYEIRTRGRAFNPLVFNQPKRKPLTGNDLKDFNKYYPKVWSEI